MLPESNTSAPDPGLSELLNLTIAAKANEANAAADAIDAVLIQLHVPEQRRLEIGLALQEALVNAVVHGCKNDPSKQIQCRLRTDSMGRIVIVITDPGPGFHPEEVADPKGIDNIFADHGRGVYLIRQLMDEVHFELGGTQITMWKY